MSQSVPAEDFGVDAFVNVDLRARYNIAPSQYGEAIIRAGDENANSVRCGGAWRPPSRTAKDPKLAMHAEELCG